MASLQGKLLIASPRLLDPNFARTVVLMVQHSDEGALGLVLNRPMETSVSDLFEQVLGAPTAAEGVLHQGGPCQGPLMVLHTLEDAADLTVRDGVYFSTERAKIESLIKGDHGAVARYFVGYAGWAAGQLEGEMETGSWLTADAERAHVFEGGARLWNKLVTAITYGDGIDYDRIPDDPTTN